MQTLKKILTHPISLIAIGAIAAVAFPMVRNLVAPVASRLPGASA
jgi:hypothetical protein